jgi:hypothetical protein
MNIWRATIHDPDQGMLQVWAGSQREVRRLALKAADGDRDAITLVELVNIPTDRRGLIAWLNLYVGTDND